MSLQAAFYSVGIPTLTPTPKRSLHPIRAQVEPSEKSVEIMRKFSEQYARRSGTYFCVDKGVTSVVIKGLADHKDALGAPLCPCRHYDDKPAEARQGFWNCPCVPMRERLDDRKISLWSLTRIQQFKSLFPLFHMERMPLYAFFSHPIMTLLGQNRVWVVDLTQIDLVEMQAISLEEIKESTSNM